MITAAILVTAALASGACVQEKNGDNRPESGQETDNSPMLPVEATPLLTVWFDEWNCRLTGVAEIAGDGWMVTCIDAIPRRYQTGRLVRINREGVIAWSQLYRTRNLELLTIIPTADGNLLFGGTDSPTYHEKQLAESRSPVVFEDPVTGEVLTAIRDISSDFILWKVDPDGNEIWQKSFRNDADNYLAAALETPDGGLLFAGTAFSDEGTQAFRLVWATADGSLVRDTTYAPFARQLCDDAILADNGDILLAGTINAISTDSAAVALMLVDQSGQVKWARAYESNGAKMLNAVTRTADGRFALVGRNYDEQGKSTGFLKLVDADGTPVWSRQFDMEVLADVAGMDNGNLLISGEGIVAAVDPEGRMLWQIRPEGLDVRSSEKILLLEDNRILLLGSARQPERDQVRTGIRGYLTIMKQ